MDISKEKLKEQGWPQEFPDKLRVGNMESNVGIVTLWTHRETVVRELDENSYAVAGNLYDKKNGIEPIVRNCLANPNIRYLIVVGSNMSGSKEVLINFFEKGVDENHIIFGTETKISKEIPLEELNKLRDNVNLIDVGNKVNDTNEPAEYARVIKEAVEKLDRKESYDEPKLFEKPSLNVESFPSENSGFIVRGGKVWDTWLKVLDTISNYGNVTKMKMKDSKRVKECVNLMAVVEEEDPDNPEMVEDFRFTEEYLKEYYDEICTAKLAEGAVYTYGSILRAWEACNGEKIDQVQDLIDYLKPDIYRKSAVAITWSVEDGLTRRYRNKDKNNPCINLIQPNIQDGILHFTVYIRSNDMFRGWPLNALGLRKLQKIIAGELGVEMGTLTTISCSAHIYEESWQEAEEVLEKHNAKPNCFWDPRGYYMIRLSEGKIKVDHYSPQGDLLKQYEGEKAREINDQINSTQHPIDHYHSSYLGEELMKAEIALQGGLEYEQDKPLDLK